MYDLCIKQKNKRPGYPGNDLKSNTMKTTFNSLKTQVNKATGQQFIQTAKKTTFWKQMKEIDETSGKTLRANFMELVYGTNKPFETYDLMFKAYCTALGLKASKCDEINWLGGTSDINVITE